MDEVCGSKTDMCKITPKNYVYPQNFHNVNTAKRINIKQ